MIKNIFYFHTKERKTLFLLLISTILYSLSSPMIQKWLNKDINKLEVISLNYSTTVLSITDCHQANLLQLEDLLEFGMEEKMAERWLNQRQRVRGFRNPEDFRKLWGLSDRKFEILAAHLQFNENPYLQTQRYVRAVSTEKNNNQSPQYGAVANSINDNQNPGERKPQNLSPFCINTATAEEFQKIRGIGPVLSDRIIRYRERLGGFYSIEQLKEVFGIEEELIDNNSAYFIIKEKTIRQIDWLDGEFREILAHPYLDYDQVVCMMQQRRSGAASAADLRECFNEEEWEKLEWYLE